MSAAHPLHASQGLDPSVSFVGTFDSSERRGAGVKEYLLIPKVAAPLPLGDVEAKKNFVLPYDVLFKSPEVALPIAGR